MPPISGQESAKRIPLNAAITKRKRFDTMKILSAKLKNEIVKQY